MISLISNSKIYNQPSFGAKLSVVLSSNPLKMKADEFLKNGNFDKAIEFLREKGLATAQKKAGTL